MTYEKHKDSIELIGYNGGGKVTYSIPGFNEAMEISIRRDPSDSRTSRLEGRDFKWQLEIEFPRYGRLHNEASNLEVAEHIRKALDEAIPQMKNFEKQFSEMEKHFQRGENDRRIKRQEAEKAAAAKLAADRPVGEKLAKAICENMIKQARETKEDSKEITFKTRGERKELRMRCVYTHSGLTLFNLGYYRISRKDAMRQLANGWLDSVDTGDIKDAIPDARLANFMLGAKA